MSEGFSLYLDFVRITAALFVLLSHTNLRVISEAVVPGSSYGHSAVVVFFVLSGLVISYTTRVTRVGPKGYFVNRAARIYSVALPALLMTPVLDMIGGRLAPSVYAGQTTHDFVWLRLITTTALLNESWGLSIQAFSNSPFWSIAYEGWYYVLFGVFIFARGRARVWTLLLACMICGPKVLLLLPVWLMGVAIDRWHPNLHPIAGVILFATSLVAFWAYHAANVEVALRAVVGELVGSEFQLDRMTYAGGFLGDYILGSVVVANFVGFRAAEPLLGKLLLPAGALIRWSSSFTLSVYLFHRPLLLFFAALIQGDPRGPAFLTQTVSLVLISTASLSYLTERPKAFYRARANALFDASAKRVRRLAAFSPNATPAKEAV